MDAYGSVWDFFEVDGHSLKEIHQISPQTAQAIIDRVEERTQLAFTIKYEYCGYEVHSDLNAAINIAQQDTVEETLNN